MKNNPLDGKTFAILDTINDAYILLDKRYKLIYINKQAELQIRKNRKLVIGKTIWDAFPLNGNTQLKKYLAQAKKLNKTIGYEQYNAKDSTWYGITINSTKDYLSIYIKDITANKQISKYNANFIGMASHELKTPVSAIKVYAQYLEKYFQNRQNKGAAAFINKLNRQINKLIYLIDNLLEIHKIQTGILLFDKEYFNVKELIEDIIHDISAISDKHKFTLQEMEDIYVFADKNRIHQVMTTLLINAVKYSPNSNKITIRSIVKNKHVQISIQDFGIGIPENKIKKIFSGFFNVENNNSLILPGIGLGLYIIAEIIKQHKGKIWAKSVEGKGSIFYFSLPVKKTNGNKNVLHVSKKG